ncbi:F-box/kelch-repeat protein At3g23880-like [Papaver somniferum]|uniref:F-box/kelch-repeat protein At3g23880-like n=1 Tax=Papaver somniferum TaxID=3469 RepID=UPI000E6FAD41|nr:F-box/kelch-repeat protein At3g23880-like [Papaver somniferum]
MGNFKDLPADIALDIITRLPAESILDCKLVCRKWRNLVSYHPSISKLHLTHILNHSNESEGKLSFLVMDRNKKFHYFEYNESSHDEKPPTHSIRRFDLTPPFTSFPVYYEVLGSFNGLVCLYGHQDCTACIFNPVTKKYVTLPSIMRNCNDDAPKIIHCSSGFGYLPSTNDYKFVEMYKLRIDLEIFEVDVYTLGSGNGWSTVGRFDTKFAKVYNGVGEFVNGALHWRRTERSGVVDFDMTEEKFHEHISSPPFLENIWYDCTIGELDGVLYYSIRYHYSEISDIWLLKEKNDQRDMKQQAKHELLGWSKEYSLPDSKKPLALTKSGGVLCFNHSSLGIYDAIASTSKELREFSGISQIFPHKNTLISLKELGEEYIKVMATLLLLVLVEIQDS